MKVIIIDDIIINFNNVSYVTYSYSSHSSYISYGLNFIFNNSYYNGSFEYIYNASFEFRENQYLYFPCSKEKYQKIHKKIIDFLKDKDETILELNI